MDFPEIIRVVRPSCWRDSLLERDINSCRWLVVQLKLTIRDNFLERRLLGLHLN